MLRFSLHICLLMVLIPILGLGQTGIAGNTKSFYTELGQRDALNEQQLIMISDDDHKDFWKDQANFESLLAAQNPEGYQIYLNSKGFAYRLHQKICNTECEHSEYYLNRAAFYAIKGQEDIGVVYASKIKKPQVKD